MQLQRIPHIYHDTIYARKLFEIIFEKHSRIKSLYKQLSNFNDLKTSSGILLDRLGGNLKILRNGRSDEEYRKIIGFEISTLQFLGSVEEIKSILATYFNNFVNSFYINEYSGKIFIKIPSNIEKKNVIDLLKKIKTAGVGLQVDFEIYIEDYLISELEKMTLEEIENIKLARR